jgi:hypothetical protein
LPTGIIIVNLLINVCNPTIDILNNKHAASR